jgi:hypothetical protein
MDLPKLDSSCSYGKGMLYIPIPIPIPIHVLEKKKRDLFDPYHIKEEDFDIP